MKKPLSIEEIKSLRKPLRNVNIEHKESLTTLESFALKITRNVG
ncbi:MAG: Membrane protein-like protein, partial [Patescibacteria group bacterium]|nr:Membrane protein-like protein [Patescibacteria group bacterium]